MEDQRARWNYAVLLGQGVANSAADELTSVKLVLPFLYASVGAPVFFAGLLVPIATVAKRSVQILVAPLVSVARSNKVWISFAALSTALALVLVSLSIKFAPVGWLVPIFVFVALAIGAGNGLSSLAFQNLIGRVLSDERRRRLLFTQSSLAGLFVAIVAFVSQLILRPGTSLTAHQELIWLGISLFVLSALTTMAVREPAAPRQSEQDAGAARSRLNVSLRDSFRTALALPWFGRFLMARTLYLSIELAIPFFSIHAASFHGSSVSGLNAFVIASSIGLVVGGVIWPLLGRRSVDVILILAALVTCIGGVLAMAIELQLVSQGIFLYAVVFVLVSLGVQGIRNGRTLYLIAMTTDEERPFCIAVANVTIGIIAIAFGAILGALASFRGVAWPIFALVALNALAALYTLRLSDGRRAA
jgi:hypothetical protein